MDQNQTNLAAIVKQAVRDTLRHGKPTTLTFCMKTGLWTAQAERPKPTPAAGFIRRYLAGERNTQ